MPSSTIYQTHTPSPLGTVLLAATDQGLAGLWFLERQQHAPHTAQWQEDASHPVFQAATEQLQRYFKGQLKHFSLALDTVNGTPFQRAVWQALQTIPYGQTQSYGQIAQRIGKPQAVRAVGAAIGRNPHSIIVPCHRVLGAKGALTGFGGGLDRKHALLSHEAQFL